MKLEKKYLRMHYSKSVDKLRLGSNLCVSFVSVLHIDRGLQVLPESIHLKLSKAECFMCLGEIEVNIW